ncbi:lysine--tRNA ligase [Rickettsia endosymbiont of Oedothorax gibbosus]|uniref:lysine--tRNA ligase n=1 Tax=Rickettsia endosymbiont of Oedothorax gibbosus TaxID=931099 RepID=UPI002023E8B2|nr:lysine--tRNA ligase [Rickettsia endosymbiont of Oedothorax gibbosus]
MSELEILEDAVKSNAWTFLEAKRILDQLGGKTPAKGYVLFETGYGPSGLPHIGTFAEVARSIMVQEAFKQLSNIPTKMFCFSDDMDGLRKVPSNIPNPDMVALHIGRPLTSVPDPFGECESYGHYMNSKLRSFLDKFGFKYQFVSSTECYKSGLFDQMMLKVIDKYDEIMALMLPTFRAERKATYSPFMPICPKTGIVLQVPISKVDRLNGTISYQDEEGKLVEVPVTKGHCKLQWKPDFGMRWASLQVDYEMYGKEHMNNAKLYSEICRILGGIEPVQFFYELFLNEDGEKISKSTGNGITVDQWLQYAPMESMSLFMYQNPTRAKRLHFDVIPKNVDEYITFNKKYHLETDQVKRFANPVHHIHHGNVPIIETFGISFSLLLNLASVCNPEDKSVLWGFISQYAPDATPQNAPYLDHLTDFAIGYYNDFIKANKCYLMPNVQQKVILQEISTMLSALPVDSTSEQIQEKIYDIGNNHGYHNLRDYFKELYQILLGQTEGPRLGSFFKLFGIQDTINLIDEKNKA